MLKLRWFFILIIPFLFFHNNSLAGPDGDVYLAVAHSIVEKGSLNILPETLSLESPHQITKSRHAPIHQNIGGVLFILPASFLSVASHFCAMVIPDLPQRFYDISYHEGLWLGCVTYLLAMLSCFMIYRVARCYHGAASVVTALLSCVFGGPLFLYAVIYPCNTNLPAAFLASLLLYIYHFASRERSSSWALLGAVFGLGIFVRFEFAVWVFPLLYVFYSDRDGFSPWHILYKRICLVGIGSMFFVAPALLLRQIIFGQLGNSYSIQLDLANLSKAYLMLWGTRNGLFVFWPILLIALIGYFVSLKDNPPVYHAMFILLVSLTLICGTVIFWNGELGYSFGQRWFLVGFPCFVLYLSRLFDLSKRYFTGLLSVCVLCTIWALFIWAAYGQRWIFPNEVTGFLMPLQFSRIFYVLTTYYPLFIKKMLSTLFVPKHIDVFWMLPLFSLVSFAALQLGKRLDSDKRFEYGFAVIVLMSLVTNIFLAGAGSRGERTFREIAANNPQATFITRNYEVNFEILSSMLDSMAFFMELGDYKNARYKKEKTLNFLKAEAPDQLNNFIQSCNALEMRQSLGWYRLFPEQIHFDLLKWQQAAVVDGENHRPQEDITRHFLF
jgi:hypothetical protein